MSDKASTETATSTPNAGFADDDLGRLQGILLGDHARKTSDRIDTLEQALLGAVADLRADMTKQVEALGARIDGEQSTRTQALSNVTDRLQEQSKTQAADAKKLQTALDKATSDLEAAVHDTSTDARLELEAAQRDISRTIETLSSDQRDYAVDRRGLSSLLASLAQELDDGSPAS